MLCGVLVGACNTEGVVMKNMKWPDNTCYVDRTHTNLHGDLSTEDIAWITDIFEGQVSFTPTTNLASARDYLAKGMEVGHYIRCRTTHPAFNLLLGIAKLKDANCKMERGESC